MPVTQKIKQYLNDIGVSQSFISKKTGIDPVKLNLSLNSKRKLTFDEYELICWALEVSTDRFLTPKAPSNKDTA